MVKSATSQTKSSTTARQAGTGSNTEVGSGCGNDNDNDNDNKRQTSGCPKPAPKPAAPPVKDMGFFGNFEIGAGFGAQKASGVRGVVTGLNDGPNPNRLKAGRKVQTLDGEEYTLEFLGRRDRDKNIKLEMPTRNMHIRFSTREIYPA